MNSWTFVSLEVALVGATRTFARTFDASAGQSGFVGIGLGIPDENWSSAQSTGSTFQVTINRVIGSGNPALTEMITLTTQVPDGFGLIAIEEQGNP
jgi:hypothetical protein